MADSHIACRSHAVLLPCRAAKGLECVFPIRFTQCGRVWFTFAMPYPCHAPTMPFFSRPQHSTAVERRPCCTVALRRTACSEHGMASVNQTRPHCVNKMVKTHSKPLAAWHGRGTAWTQHGNGMLCVNRPLISQWKAAVSSSPPYPHLVNERNITLAFITFKCKPPSGRGDALPHLLSRCNGI